MAEKSFVRRHWKPIMVGAAAVGAWAYGSLHGQSNEQPHPSASFDLNAAATFACKGIRISQTGSHLLLSPLLTGDMPKGSHLQFSVDYKNRDDIRAANGPADITSLAIPEGTIEYIEVTVQKPDGHVTLCPGSADPAIQPTPSAVP